MFHYSFIQTLFGIYVRLMFVFFSTIHYIVFISGQIVVPKKDREEFWRMGVTFNNWLLLKIAGITLKLDHVPDELKPSSIIVSNHPTFMDGFIYFSLFGPNVIPVTGPARYFPFPFDRVFKAMGAIHVARSDEEEERFPDSCPRKLAVDRMVSALRDKKHILIFPEGHVERDHHLYYAHTGSARASLLSQKQIAVFGITGAEHVIGNGLRMRPGTLHVHFGKYIAPHTLEKKNNFHAEVKKMRTNIERAFVDLLPHKYIPPYITYRKPEKVAAFFDIDDTLYAGNFGKDCVLDALRHHFIPASKGWYVLGLLALDLLGIIPHKMLMEKIHRVFKGQSPKKIAELAQRYFDKKGVHHFFAPAFAFIKNHQEKGHHIILVSETIEPIAKIFAQHLRADGFCGTELIKKRGTYTGDISLLRYGTEKSRFVHSYAKEHHIDLKQSYAYGNSFESDHFMLGAVGHACAINPNRKLKKWAQRHGWPIISGD